MGDVQHNHGNTLPSRCFQGREQAICWLGNNPDTKWKVPLRCWFQFLVILLATIRYLCVLGGREGGREGGWEGGRGGGTEGGREGGKKGEREGGREGGREGRREGGRLEGGGIHACVYHSQLSLTQRR